MLAKITGVPGNIAFNLGIAMVFALSATGAFGLVYTLLRVANRRINRIGSDWSNLIGALSGPLFLLIIGNL
jgi:uncharacterized membrane protein